MCLNILLLLQTGTQPNNNLTIGSFLGEGLQHDHKGHGSNMCVYTAAKWLKPNPFRRELAFFSPFFSFFLSHRVWSAHPAKDGTAMAILEMEGMEGGARCLL